MNRFIATLFFLVIPLSSSADLTGTVAVDAKANIFVAGGNAVLNSSRGDMNGILPIEITFPQQIGQILTFTNVIGETTCHDGGSVNTHPDGSGDGECANGSTNIFSFNSISGILHSNRTMFLVGVFLEESQSQFPAPPRLDFTEAHSITKISPQLNQVFFIGDGLTETGIGERQKFYIPNTATRLFLGFADAYSFNGVPGYYEDNRGQLTVSYQIETSGITQLDIDNARQAGRDECMAPYSLEGKLHLPCVMVPGPFGGNLLYQADLEVIPFSEPFQFVLISATPID